MLFPRLSIPATGLLLAPGLLDGLLTGALFTGARFLPE